MTNKKIIKSVLPFGLGMLVLGLALPVLAQGINASTSVNVEARAEVKAAALTERIAKLKSRAGQEIDRRITALNRLNTRVAAMKKVSASVKTSIAASIQNQITVLTALKAKIDADTDVEVLKADVKSITDSYRIFALIIPQGHILAAADRIKTIAESITALDVKLDARIAEAKTAGKDVAALEALSIEIKAKVASAKVNADAAIALVSPLTPDMGDQTKFEANKKALKDAREKVRAGNEDLKTAHRDAKSIAKGLREFKLKVEVNASSTTQQ